MHHFNHWDCFNVNRPWLPDEDGKPVKPTTPIGLFGTDNIGNLDFSSMGGDEMSDGACGGKYGISILRWRARINFVDNWIFQAWASSAICSLIVKSDKEQVVRQAPLYDLYDRRRDAQYSLIADVPPGATVRVVINPFTYGAPHPIVAPQLPDNAFVWLHLEGHRYNKNDTVFHDLLKG